MKRILFLFLIPFIGIAQERNTIISSGSYATGDTTGWISVRPHDQLTLGMHFNDSVNVVITLDYKIAGYSSSTYFQSYSIEADSTNSANTTGFDKTKTLRRFGTDNIPGAELVRIRMTKKTTKNGVTSPTYDAWLWRN